MSELTQQVVTDLCERAVELAEMQLALCPRQDVALDMVDVVAKVLRHRVQAHWLQLRKRARVSASVKAKDVARQLVEMARRPK